MPPTQHRRKRWWCSHRVELNHQEQPYTDKGTFPISETKYTTYFRAIVRPANLTAVEGGRPLIGGDILYASHADEQLFAEKDRGAEWRRADDIVSHGARITVGTKGSGARSGIVMIYRKANFSSDGTSLHIGQV